MTTEAYYALAFLVGSVALIYLAVIIIILVLRRALWYLAFVFFLIDDLMWFLYNPFRSFMKNQEAKVNRVGYYTSTVLLLKPIWQIGIWFLTTPLRVVTALYFDVLVYMFVAVSDSIEELLHPKLKRMRNRKGFSYWSGWVLGFPVRAGWLLLKNSLAVIDSIAMFFVSVAWPSFTVFHGSSEQAVYDITQKGRWLVGIGNYGGSGIYFGRTIKTALYYSGQKGGQGRNMIVARVTFTMLRNCGTLLEHKRHKVGGRGEELAQEIKFPFYATELWRAGERMNWWEYCLLHGNATGEYIRTWRIRPIGYVQTRKANSPYGHLAREWGGKAHYCLNPASLFMAVLSAFICIILAIGYGYLFFQ